MSEALPRSFQRLQVLPTEPRAAIAPGFGDEELNIPPARAFPRRTPEMGMCVGCEHVHMLLGEKCVPCRNGVAC